MKKQKIVVDGALLLAIYSILLFLTIILPVIGIFAVFVLPIPFIIYSNKYNLKQAIVFFIGACIVSFLFANFMGFGFTLMFGVAGVVIGRLIKSKRSGLELLVGATVSYLITLVVVYVGSVVLFSMDFTTIMAESTADTMKMFESTLQLTGTESEPIIQELEKTLEVFPYLLPSTFLITAFFLALVSQLICYPVIKRLRIEVNKLPKFRELMLPKSLLWYYLIVLFLTFMEMEPGSFLYMAVLNVFYVLQLLMILQGLSLIYYFSYAKGIPKFVPVIITIIAPFLLYIIRILGIIDLGFQLRHRIKPKS